MMQANKTLSEMDIRKITLLERWANHLGNAAQSGGLTSGKPCILVDKEVGRINGPRAGGLEFHFGLSTHAVLHALSKSDGATLRQFIPWEFSGTPSCFMQGRYVRVEAGWPDEWAEKMIRLSDLSDKPKEKGRWSAGRNELGGTVRPGISNQTAHWLIAGTSGAGKSCALRAMVLQLSADPDNEIVLIDGKMGESLKVLERLPSIVAPVAVEIQQARNALGWAATKMKERYEAGYHEGKILVVVDEFQELAHDAVVSDLLRKLCAQGRSAGVACFLATQHPAIASLGDPSTRRNLSGKIALRVNDADASRVILGKSPRADRLLGAGDEYLVTPGIVHRLQGVYVDEQEITAAEGGGPGWQFQRWPEFSGEDAGQEMDETVHWHYTGDELAVALESAVEGYGRDRMIALMKDQGMTNVGPTRGRRLIKLAKAQNVKLNEDGYHVCRKGDSISDPASVRIIPNVW